MNPFPDVQTEASHGRVQAAEMLAIAAITHIAANEALLGRFIDLSRISIPQLKAGLDKAPVQRAALDFLANHEPDLISARDRL